MPPAKEVTAAATFSLKLGGPESDGMFESVSGFSAAITPIMEPHQDAQGKTLYSSVPSATAQWADVTITRAFSKEKSLYDWHRKIIETGTEGQVKDLTVTYLDNKGQPITTWNIKQAWPTSYSIDGVASSSASPVTETVTFANLGVERK